MKKVVFFLFIFCSIKAHAGAQVEFTSTYISDSMTASSSTNTSSKYYYGVGLLFDFSKNIWGGWNYSGLAHSDQQTTTTTFGSQDTGPYLKWVFGRGRIYNITAAYNLVSRATYSDGTTSENWEGTSMWFQFGVAPEVKNGLKVGASLNYFMATYTKKTVSSVESTASNSKTWIFPALIISKEW